jgi:hypothetical protein
LDTGYALRGIVVGPLIMLPVVEYTDPWQGQGKLLLDRLYAIVHP